MNEFHLKHYILWLIDGLFIASRLHPRTSERVSWILKFLEVIYRFVDLTVDFTLILISIKSHISFCFQSAFSRVDLITFLFHRSSLLCKSLFLFSLYETEQHNPRSLGWYSCEIHVNYRYSQKMIGECHNQYNVKMDHIFLAPRYDNRRHPVLMYSLVRLHSPLKCYILKRF